MDAPSERTSPIPGPISSQPQPAAPPLKPEGRGCFAIGCGGCAVFGVIALVLFIALGWFGYVQAVKALTAEAPINLELNPSDREYAAAEAKMNQFRSALERGEATTIAFSAADLNALFARDPAFADRPGKMRVELDESEATVQMSYPLDSVKAPMLAGRWFNGRSRLRFSYADGAFRFDPDWIEAHGREFTGGFVRSFGDSFSRSFSKSFIATVRKNGGWEAWKNVKTMKIEHGQLVITTDGPNATGI
ncbi:MAG: hypothetical protein ACR2NX_07670 [Chthoniobacterales bacterium]